MGDFVCCIEACAMCSTSVQVSACFCKHGLLGYIYVALVNQNKSLLNFVILTMAPNLPSFFCFCVLTTFLPAFGIKIDSLVPGENNLFVDTHQVEQPVDVSADVYKHFVYQEPQFAGATSINLITGYTSTVFVLVPSKLAHTCSSLSVQITKHTNPKSSFQANSKVPLSPTCKLRTGEIYHETVTGTSYTVCSAVHLNRTELTAVQKKQQTVTVAHAGHKYALLIGCTDRSLFAEIFDLANPFSSQHFAYKIYHLHSFSCSALWMGLIVVWFEIALFCIIFVPVTTVKENALCSEDDNCSDLNWFYMFMCGAGTRSKHSRLDNALRCSVAFSLALRVLILQRLLLCIYVIAIERAKEHGEQFLSLLIFLVTAILCYLLVKLCWYVNFELRAAARKNDWCRFFVMVLANTTVLFLLLVALMPVEGVVLILLACLFSDGTRTCNVPLDWENEISLDPGGICAFANIYLPQTDTTTHLKDMSILAGVKNTNHGIAATETQPLQSIAVTQHMQRRTAVKTQTIRTLRPSTRASTLIVRTR